MLRRRPMRTARRSYGPAAREAGPPPHARRARSRQVGVRAQRGMAAHPNGSPRCARSRPLTVVRGARTSAVASLARRGLPADARHAFDRGTENLTAPVNAVIIPHTGTGIAKTASRLSGGRPVRPTEREAGDVAHAGTPAHGAAERMGSHSHVRRSEAGEMGRAGARLGARTATRTREPFGRTSTRRTRAGGGGSGCAMTSGRIDRALHARRGVPGRLPDHPDRSRDVRAHPGGPR